MCFPSGPADSRQKPASQPPKQPAYPTAAHGEKLSAAIDKVHQGARDDDKRLFRHPPA